MTDSVSASAPSLAGTTLDIFPAPEDRERFGAERPASRSSPLELLARFQFLSQAFTTRSDVFTAYIVVRGYPADDFRKGPVEERRFYAILDRSGIHVDDEAQAGGDVRVLAVRSY